MQPKNQPPKRRKYDSTFKADVLKMIANGQSVAYVAQTLGISEALIHKWKQRNKRAAAARKKNNAFRNPFPIPYSRISGCNNGLVNWKPSVKS